MCPHDQALATFGVYSDSICNTRNSLNAVYQSPRHPFQSRLKYSCTAITLIVRGRRPRSYNLLYYRYIYYRLLQTTVRGTITAVPLFVMAVSGTDVAVTTHHLSSKQGLADVAFADGALADGALSHRRSSGWPQLLHSSSFLQYCNWGSSCIQLQLLSNLNIIRKEIKYLIKYLIASECSSRKAYLRMFVQEYLCEAPVEVPPGLLPWLLLDLLLGLPGLLASPGPPLASKSTSTEGVLEFSRFSAIYSNARPRPPRPSWPRSESA